MPFPLPDAKALRQALSERDFNETVFLALFAAIGTITVARMVITLLSAVWRIFLRPGKNLRKYGSWAVVTGCTDGIGKAFCEELAKKKINLVLISRTESKLKEVAAEVTGKSKGVEVKIVPVDFSTAGDADYERIAAAVKDLDVGILINNVGLSYPHAMYLHELDQEYAEQMINVNCRATVRMCKLVLPGMLSRKRGAIVNIGSAAATVLPADPLYSVYAGTKGFVDQFSRTLHTEYADKGIHVQLQAPLYVATKMSKIRRASLTVPSPKAYARAGLATIGYDQRVTPFWAHAIMWGAIAALPPWLMDTIRLGQTKSMRVRALKKKAQQEKAN